MADDDFKKTKFDAVCEICHRPCRSEDLVFDRTTGMRACPECRERAAKERDPYHIPTPKEVKAYLDKYVIGQEEAKCAISVAVHDHMKRIKHHDIEKSNILLVGPTGSGKTLIAKTLASYLNLPFTIADATSLTEAGYVGDDVENILTRLLNAADGNIQEAEKGIVFIDEIDKIAKMTKGRSITRDVSGEGVQQALLKILEGAKVRVTPEGGRKNPMGNGVMIDTTNILFICGGAFPDLGNKVAARTVDEGIGFFTKPMSEKEKNNKLYKNATLDDFVEFGMIPEFMGRLAITAFLDPIEAKDYREILTEPKNSIVRQFKRSYDYDGGELVFEEGALSAIAEKAFKMGTGARALRSIVEKVLRPISFELPSLEGRHLITVTEDNVINGSVPKIEPIDDEETFEEYRADCCR